jgi:hypothetical protein
MSVVFAISEGFATHPVSGLRVHLRRMHRGLPMIRWFEPSRTCSPRWLNSPKIDRSNLPPRFPVNVGR